MKSPKLAPLKIIKIIKIKVIMQETTPQAEQNEDYIALTVWHFFS